MRGTRRTTTDPITPQNIQGSNPAINSKADSEKRADYVEHIADEEQLRGGDIGKKDLPQNSEKSKQLKKEIDTRKPGDDVDPKQSLANE